MMMTSDEERSLLIGADCLDLEGLHDKLMRVSLQKSCENEEPEERK